MKNFLTVALCLYLFSSTPAQADLQSPASAFELTINLRDGVGQWRPTSQTVWLNSGATYTFPEGTSTPAYIEFREVSGYWTPPQYAIMDFSAGSETIERAYISDPEIDAGNSAVSLISIGRNRRTEARGGFSDGSLVSGTYSDSDFSWVPFVWTAKSRQITALPTLPLALSTYAFVVAQGASLAGDIIVGQVVDSRMNMLPVVWNHENGLNQIEILPLPADASPETTNGTLYGRAFATNEAGTTIVGHVRSQGILQGAVWTREAIGGPWSLAQMIDGDAVGLSEASEIWLRDLSESGNVKAGWAFAWSDGNASWEIVPFVLEGSNLTLLPKAPDSEENFVQTVSGDGRQLAGKSTKDGIKSLMLWEKDEAGNWLLQVIPTPEEYLQFDVENYLNPESEVLSAYVFHNGSNFQLIYDPAVGFISAADWIEEHFNVSFGADWLPAPVYANPATGVAHGQLRSSFNHLTAFSIQPAVHRVTVHLRDGIGWWRPVGQSQWLSSGATYAVPASTAPPLRIEFAALPDYWIPPEYTIWDFASGSQTIEVAYYSLPVPSAAAGSVEVFTHAPNARTEVRGGFKDGSVLSGTYVEPGTSNWIPYIWTPAWGMMVAPRLQGAWKSRAFVLAQGATLAANAVVGRVLDPNWNVVPVIWQDPTSLSSPQRLPLPDSINASTAFNRFLGRAMFISEDGKTIVGSVVDERGWRVGARWRKAEVTNDWRLDPIADLEPFFSLENPNFVEVVVSGISTDGQTVGGYAFGYFNQFNDYKELPFVWENETVTLLPVASNAGNSSVSATSGDGRQLAGVSSINGTDSLTIWDKLPSGEWSVRTMPPPDGYSHFSPSDYINAHSHAISGYVYSDRKFIRLMYIPGQGYELSSEWVLRQFGASFGPDWMPAPIYADPATGIAFGVASTMENHQMGFWISNPPVSSTFAAAPFLADLPADARGPLDTNGPFAVPNLMAHALGLHPHHITRSHLPYPDLIQSGESTVLSFRIPINKLATDVRIVPEATSTLDPEDWQSDPANLTVIETPDGLHVIDKIPFSADVPRFLRFRVEPID